MNIWRHCLSVLLLLITAATVHAAAFARVLVVSGRGVSADAQAAIGSAVAQDGGLLDSRDYLRLTRARGISATSETGLRQLAPELQADLIIYAHRAGAKLVLSFRDGRSGEVLREERFAMAARRGRAAKRLRARLTQSVKHMLSSMAHSRPASVVERPAPTRPEPEPEPEPNSLLTPEPPLRQVVAEQEPELADEDSVDEAALAPQSFWFELSAGFGGAMRESALPTRLGVHQLNTGLYPGIALGLAMRGSLGGHGVLRAAIDYRTSLGLRGVEMQRATEMSTPLRSHGVGFGVAPGYRFGGVDSVALHLYLGWYLRGLRPVAQLALPSLSWHGPVIRPELFIPISDGAVILRLAPEMVVVAGLRTTLPDQSGIAHSGLGFGAEASIDVRVAEAMSVRIEYRELHVRLNTAWAQRLTDVQRFGAVRAILHY